jgi:hypothetical protein
MDQIAETVADRTSDQQRRERIFIDVAGQVLARPRPLPVKGIGRHRRLLPRPLRKFLRGRAGLVYGRTCLFAEIARCASDRRRRGHVAVTAGAR